MYKVSYWLSSLIVGSLLLTACGQTSIPTSTTTPASAQSKHMHPSWDEDKNGVNDCETNGSCDHTIDYTQPRPARIATPAFDCNAMDNNSIEQLICQDPALAQLDNLLASAYGAAIAQIPNEQLAALKAKQRNWIKKRNECGASADKYTCIKTAYEQRIAELQARQPMRQPQ